MLALGLAGYQQELPGRGPTAPLAPPVQASLPVALPGALQAGDGGTQIYFPVMPVDATAPLSSDGSVIPPPDDGGVDPPPIDDDTNPHVLLAFSTTQPRVGQKITVVARPVNIGLAYYYLYAQDESSDTPAVLVRVTYDNQVSQSQGSSAILRLVSATGTLDLATFVLEAVAPGETSLWVNAIGEVRTPDGAYIWSGGGSQPVLITVSN